MQNKTDAIIKSTENIMWREFFHFKTCAIAVQPVLPLRYWEMLLTFCGSTKKNSIMTHTAHLLSLLLYLVVWTHFYKSLTYISGTNDTVKIEKSNWHIFHSDLVSLISHLHLSNGPKRRRVIFHTGEERYKEIKLHNQVIYLRNSEQSEAWHIVFLTSI